MQVSGVQVRGDIEHVSLAYMLFGNVDLLQYKLTARLCVPALKRSAWLGLALGVATSVLVLWWLGLDRWKAAADCQMNILQGRGNSGIERFLHEEELRALGLSKDDAVSLTDKWSRASSPVQFVVSNEPTVNVGVHFSVPVIAKVGSGQIVMKYGVLDLPDRPKVLISELWVMRLQALVQLEQRSRDPGLRKAIQEELDALRSIGVPGVYNLATGAVVPLPSEYVSPADRR